MTKQIEQSERRSVIRISPKGSVVVEVDGELVHARVGNISSKGMLAIAKSVPSAGLLERDVEVDLRLDGADAQWLQLTGRVLRVEGCDIAIAFSKVPSRFAELMQNTSSASHGNERVLSVVLVDATEPRRLAVSEAFRKVGCAVVDVATPLQAIVRLGESQFEPDLIAIADSLPAETADELRRFVEHAHPGAKLVTINDSDLQPDGLVHWLSSVKADLLRRIRQLLGEPR